jgi:PIN domain nuclease of toxin-antitoxin system
MLVAQAQQEDLTLVTADEIVRAYPVKTLAA